MDGFGLRPRSLAIVLAALLSACSARVPVEELPDAEETLSRIGRRLSQSLSIEELAPIAQHGDRLLGRLTSQERNALGHGAFRFRVDRPVIVDVALPGPAVPFWLGDQGFDRIDTPLRVDGADWTLYRKAFPTGWVGLGVNGLDRSPRAHYAVFVRSDPPDRPPTALRGIDQGRWRCVTAREGTSAAFGRSLPIDTLPKPLEGALLLQPSHDRRHATLLARGRVWKTHVVSGRTPDQVSVAFGADASRSLAWTWRTEPGVSTSVLRLANAGTDGKGPDPSRPIRNLRGESQRVSSPDLLNDPVIRRHRAVASDLSPDTAYVYSLGDGTENGSTPWMTVRTGPSRSRSRSRSFRFLYLGDPQCGLEAWGNLLSAANRRHPDAAFVLIAGDLVDRGNERTNWDHFFLRASGVFETLPMMPCVGNHEYLDQGPRLYRAFFDLPRNGPEGIDSNLVYAFEYAGAFVAVLDSTLASVDAGIARKQADWLDDALGRTEAEWKFVMFHHPVYASHPKRESPALREAWVPVFDKHHVDLVLQGHDHAYQRSYPLRAGRRVATPDQGTTYVVSVSGTKYYDQRPRGETAVGFTNRSTYQTIDIDEPANRLTYRAWDRDGRELDRLMIEKPGVTVRFAEKTIPVAADDADRGMGGAGKLIP